MNLMSNRYKNMTPHNFRMYVLGVVNHITKTRRKVDVHFDSIKETKPYYVAALRLSKNKTYWLVGSYLCPPEDPPSKLRTLVRSRHALKGWKEQTLIGYTVCSFGDLPLSKEMSAIIVGEHKRSLNKAVHDRGLKKLMGTSPSMEKTFEVFVRPQA